MRAVVDVAPSLPPVFIDRIQVQQVLVNLIRNALEAMAGCSVRNLTVGATAEGNTVKVSVADTGPGLSEEVARRLFEPFVTTKSQGMGIGLAISREIIEAHGGRLWAENRHEGGCVFTFTLPIAQLEEEEGEE